MGLLIVWVGVGGVVGAVARYLVVMGVNGVAGGSGFPYGTLAVNAVGCFLIGLIVGYAEAHRPLERRGAGFPADRGSRGVHDVLGVRDGYYQAVEGRVVLVGVGERVGAGGGGAGGGGGRASGGGDG